MFITHRVSITTPSPTPSSISTAAPTPTPAAPAVAVSLLYSSQATPQNSKSTARPRRHRGSSSLAQRPSLEPCCGGASFCVRPRNQDATIVVQSFSQDVRTGPVVYIYIYIHISIYISLSPSLNLTHMESSHMSAGYSGLGGGGSYSESWWYCGS